MAKELYDGIYSSHKLVFIERVEKNLKFYLKDKINNIKITGQNIFCEASRKSVYEILREINKNPELEVNVLSSINQYISSDKYNVLLCLSSLSHNFSMTLKIPIGSVSLGINALKTEYKELIMEISTIFGSALFYLKEDKISESDSDIILKSHILEGIDTFDVYLQTQDNIVSKAYIDTELSAVDFCSIAGNISINNLLTYVSRFDYNAGIFPELCLCLAIEESLSIKVPKRMQYIRMIVSELFRITNHINYISKISMILGSSISSYAQIENEIILRLIEEITGSRVHPNFIRPGGVKKDLSNESLKNLSANMSRALKKINRIEALLLDNTIITAKLKNLGKTNAETAVFCGATGPNLRATGARYDLRKNRNLLLYKDVSFLIAYGRHGDCLERIYLRFLEIYQSINIITQLINEIAQTPILDYPEYKEIELPYSEIISSIECPHGVFKIFFEAKQNKIIKLVVMGPSRNSLNLAEKILPGNRIEDVELILASLDLSGGEIMQESI